MTPRPPLGPALLVFLLIPGCAAPATDLESAEVRRVILSEVAHHPQMAPADLYKLLHQAAMGSEHGVPDTVSVRLWMERELSTMGEGMGELAIDTIAPGDRVVRVNLRPWVAAGRSTDSLLTAFVRTAALFAGDTAVLGRYLAIADTLAAQSELPFEAAAWRAQVDGARRDGYPAVHHSDLYEANYRPAYRVVAGPLVP